MEKYPDTAAGAIQCLADESTLNMAGATARQDPYLPGVWLVTQSRKIKGAEQAVVWLAGYLDQFGETRQRNDFEVV